MKTEVKINILLQLLQLDFQTYKRGEYDYRVCEHREGFGLILPLDWVETWVPELKAPWEGFMRGQTFCEYGFYLCDVDKFLRYKRETVDA